MQAETSPTQIYKVSELNRETRNLLEGHFTTVWVEGEISNFVVPRSGHWYFTLKDDQAQIRAAMFRGNNQRINFTPQEGMQVLVKARVSLYEGRGDFQLIVEFIEEMGHGALLRAFEQLKKRLADEGLFDDALKRPLPALPKTVGVITSATGAALHDVCTALKRRFSLLNVIIYPTLVQGADAATHIIQALTSANKRNECDVLLLVRGGGSLEDLWCFNDEKLARLIRASKIPIVTGIGHEIDTTIADLASDLRAPTPTAAAEIVSPDVRDIILTVTNQLNRMTHTVTQRLHHLTQQVHHLQKRLPDPKRYCQSQHQTLDYLSARLQKAMDETLKRPALRITHLNHRLAQCAPHRKLKTMSENLSQLKERLSTTSLNLLKTKQDMVSHIAKTLNALSPLATLERGYAICFSEDKKLVVRDSGDVKSGDTIITKLHRGEVKSKVI